MLPVRAKNARPVAVAAVVAVDSVAVVAVVAVVVNTAAADATAINHKLNLRRIQIARPFLAGLFFFGKLV